MDRNFGMDELFVLSDSDRTELLAILSKGMFNRGRAVYWPCTERLLDSSVYKKIETAVEQRLGAPVYFVFDEIFTPAGDLGGEETFQSWHKDMEDGNFAGGCFNVWIPLYSSGPEVAGLDIITNDELNTYDDALDARAPQLPHPIREDQVLFVNRATMDTFLVDEADIRSERNGQKNHVYLLNSGRFHRAVRTHSFEVRFGIKFALSPFTSLKVGAPDMAAFGYVANLVRKQHPQLDARMLHYETAKALSANFAERFNGCDVRSQVLYRMLFERM